ncbi:MAG: STAS domain-containing protein [Phycisphaerales bacterium]|jgi:anti-anti-sigma factor|nr:STAS domain-containing protein [Phycisphaerales bacterium]
MKLRFEDHGRLCVVQVDGECVGESAESLRRACVERFTGGTEDMILDVSETSLIDSIGLEVLLDVADVATERRGRCLLAAPGEPLRSILEITRIADRLEVHDAVESAARVLR